MLAMCKPTGGIFQRMGKQEKNRKQPLAMHLAPRCGAKGKRTGLPCRAPAMKNGRCRLHGGKSSGPPAGNKNALKHGEYTVEAIAERRYVKRLLRDSRNLMDRFSI